MPAASLPPAGDPRTLYVVDLTGYVHRAYHSVPALSSPTGEPTHATYGATQMLLSLVKQARPSFFAVAIDVEGEKTFRHAIHAGYKASRRTPPPDLAPQLRRIRDVVRVLDIPCLEKTGYEADDLIATAVKLALAAGFQVVIVSADKDLLQLVQPGVVCWDEMRNAVLGRDETIAKMGVPPEQVRDLLALMGDTSDDVPGVPGVGPKTAAQLLAQFGDLDSVLARAGEVKKPALREKLVAHADEARLSRQLVSLRDDVPMTWDEKRLKWGGFDEDAVRALFTELGFGRLMPTVTFLATFASSAGTIASPVAASLGDTGPARPQQGAHPLGSPPPRAAPPKLEKVAPASVETIATLDTLRDVVPRLRDARVLAIFPAIDPNVAPDARLVGLGLATSHREALYVPFELHYLGAPRAVDRAEALRALAPLFERGDREKASASGKDDFLALAPHGIVLDGVTFDAMLASYLLDPERHGHTLVECAKSDLDLELPSFDTVTEKQRGKQLALAEVEVERAAAWAGRSAAALVALAERLPARVDADGMGKLYRDVELPLARVLADMELAGVKLDLEVLARLSKRAREEVASIEAKVRALVPGVEVNLGSPKQLETLLFDKLGLRVVKKTRTGRSTDHDVLEELAEEHELPALVLEHRAMSKLAGTYLDAFPRMVDARGRIHTRYNQAVAATGRLSSSEPNLQNIPVKTDFGREIRHAFVADTGMALVAADYSQIELRVLAHLSGDAELVDAFTQDEDVHLRTAGALFGVGPDEVTREQRARAKTVNFAVIYGQTEVALARNLKITRAEAARYIAAFFARYSGVERWLRGVVAEARETGFVTTLLGRRRWVRDLSSANRTVRFATERIARNTPVQGSSADILKLAMVALDRGLRDAHPRARMIMTVHDELVLEAPFDERDAVASLVREAMEGVVRLRVPLVVDVGIGHSWGDAK